MLRIPPPEHFNLLTRQLINSSTARHPNLHPFNRLRVFLSDLDMKKRNNLFIALEGIDGSGKSTQTKLLTEQLTRQGHKVYSTFEPTDNQIGKLIRNILKGNANADHRIIAGLFVADRLDHLLNDEYGLVK